ncbi:hypothetical protein HGD85_00545 [Rhodobacteraceae bacterium R_SAG10]|jgi:hypothetical protein|nr:hypothetical protein [Rhodobacteraceae bacterium R_SAG10]
MAEMPDEAALGLGAANARIRRIGTAQVLQIQMMIMRDLGSNYRSPWARAGHPPFDIGKSF